jgi:ABC-2 type transport system permease protein
MERFTSVFRELLYDNRLPDLVDALWCVGWAAVVFAGGFAVFRRFERKLAVLL